LAINWQWNKGFTMNSNKKSYAMLRMGRALERAITTNLITDKDRGARWAAAWGLVAGISNKAVRLGRHGLVGRKS
jgi:hypothetical protein